MIIYILISDKQYQRADEYLKNILLERKEEFLEALLRVLWGQHIVFAPQFPLFIATASIEYPYISYIASKISIFQKNLNNALKFINYSINAEPKNEEFLSLKKEIEALKVGQAMIKASKNWYKGGYIKFIIDVIKIKNSIK